MNHGSPLLLRRRTGRVALKEHYPKLPYLKGDLLEDKVPRDKNQSILTVSRA